MMTTSEYNRDQLNALIIVRTHLKDLSSIQRKILEEKIQPYLKFRTDVDTYQKKHLWDICTAKCFTDRTSACCSREGIATFFADVFINSLLSSTKELDLLEEILANNNKKYKCVYLTDKGCAWKLKPIVCEMFLCDHAKDILSEKGEFLIAEWKQLRNREKKYTWPDKPILFDELEKFFIEAGFDSPLMYFHKSPGLLNIKSKYQKIICS